MTSLIRKFKNTESGSTLLEFSLILPLLLVMTFGVVEFGYVLYQFNSAQKATQAGAREASSRLLITGLQACFVNTTLPAGTNCADVPGAAGWSGITCSGTGGGACEAAAWNAVLAEMQIYFPPLTEANLEIEIGPTTLGYVGRERPVPAITVRAKNLSYDYIAIGAVLQAMSGSSVLGDSINISSAQTTIIGEDMNEGA